MFEVFKINLILRSWRTPSTEITPEVAYAIQIAKRISFILSFDRRPSSSIEEITAV